MDEKLAGGGDAAAEPFGLYVHVPFCEQKCAYCDFYTVTDPDRAHPLYDRWLSLCLAELRLWRQDFPGLARRPVATVFFGGGTPSLLSPELFEDFLAGLRREWDLVPDLEVSLETQPATIADADYPRMVDAGINRFSVGVQTFNERLLNPTARRHLVEDSCETLRRAKATGAALSLDLICALPGQTFAEWKQDLERALEFQPDHISVYEMTYHAGTDYYRQWKGGRIAETGDDLRAEMFCYTRDRLAAAGYDHYEISNYARPGSQSRHNRIYWTLTDFIGLGAGAHSYLAGHRYANPRSAAAYARAIDGGERFAKAHDSADADVTLVENLQMALRLTEGVDMDRLAQRLGQDIRQTRRGRLEALRQRGWITLEQGRIRLTAEGQLHADSVSEFLL